MLTGIKKLWQDEAGASTVECALLAAIVVLGGAFAWEKLGGAISGSVDQVSDELAESRDGLWRQAASAAQVP